MLACSAEKVITFELLLERRTPTPQRQEPTSCEQIDPRIRSEPEQLQDVKVKNKRYKVQSLTKAILLQPSKDCQIKELFKHDKNVSREDEEYCLISKQASELIYAQGNSGKHEILQVEDRMSTLPRLCKTRRNLLRMRQKLNRTRWRSRRRRSKTPLRPIPNPHHTVLVDLATR